MKKSTFIGAVVLFAVIAVGYLFSSRRPAEREVVKPVTVQNAAYEVDGKAVRLIDGVSVRAVAPDSAVTETFRYFGNEANADLDGDGQQDVAFLLTRDAGGSGTFFYVVAALGGADGYRGTNAILLGDRIAPQTTEFLDGIVTVNYADRAPGEPLTAQPSVGVSKRFKIADGRLVVHDPSVGLLNGEWRWVRTRLNDGTTVEPKKDVFIVTFKADGTVSGKTDCNGFSGKFEAVGGKLSFGQGVASTKMYCEGAQENEFVRRLLETDGYLFQPDGSLILSLKMDSGTMAFRPAGAQ